MRNKILIIGAVAFLAYVLGSRAVKINQAETVPHQLVRMWNDPKAKKNRERRAKSLAKSASKTSKDLTKRARRTARRVRKNFP